MSAYQGRLVNYSLLKEWEKKSPLNKKLNQGSMYNRNI